MRGGSAGLVRSFYALDESKARRIEAVAMWKPLERAVREALPDAAIVFDRFHVMEQYSKVYNQVRRAEFKCAPKTDKNVLIGSRYLLLKNVDRLNER